MYSRAERRTYFKPKCNISEQGGNTALVHHDSVKEWGATEELDLDALLVKLSMPVKPSKL